MKHPLFKCTIALCGRFGTGKSLAALHNWITQAGGKVTTDIDAHTTHLVCSDEEWNAQGPIVQAAQQHESVRIVSFDWLEDTLRRRRLRSTSRYDYSKRRGVAPKASQKTGKTATKQLSAIKSTRTRAKAAQAKQRIQSGDAALSGSRAAPLEAGIYELLDVEDAHHVYRSASGRPYDVRIPRPSDEDDSSSVDFTRLRILESNDPAIGSYVCTSTYITPGRKPVTNVLAPPGSFFDLAHTMFVEIYKKRTGREWEDTIEQ